MSRTCGRWEDWRSHSGHLHGDVDRQPGPGRHPAVGWLVFQGCHHLGNLRGRHRDRIYAFVCTVLAAFLTAFYSWRLLFMTFHGKSRADHHTLQHVHESPAVMLGPLIVLSIGAIFAGWRLDKWFIGADWQQFWNGSIFNGPNNQVIEGWNRCLAGWGWRR